ncbi:MAG: RhuM family protein [Desulfurella sp.]|jgi:death-on-curing family protein
MQSKQNIIIYKTKDGPELSVKLEEETIWLTLNQIAILFDVQKAAISKHISSIFKSGELEKNSTVSKMETVQVEGNRKIKRTLTYFNLDVIIAVGYRVNSYRATQFRIWATRVLKNYLVQGYAINEKRLLEQTKKFKELQTTINFIKHKSGLLELRGYTEELLSLIQQYSNSFTLLYQYDENKITTYKTKKSKFILKYDECKDLIEQLKQKLTEKKEASDLFGSEQNDKLKSVIGTIYQTFDKKELYSTIEEKAANLFYLAIKDHPFIDGNKRIGSFLFVYFLEKNNYLYKKSGERKITDTTLVALTLLIATSKPEEKDIMINIITNLLKD